MNRKDLFACPFYFDRIELDTEKVSNAIISTPCMKAMSVDENILETNFKFLYDPIDEIVSKVMSELGFVKYNIFTSWMTKTAIGYRHGLDHMHCNSFYSGILYLTDNASPILFRHPMPWRWSSGLDDKNDGMVKSNQFIMSPKKGDIVLFPGHERHYVPPNQCDGRSIIAGNLVHS